MRVGSTQSPTHDGIGAATPETASSSTRVLHSEPCQIAPSHIQSCPASCATRYCTFSQRASHHRAIPSHCVSHPTHQQALHKDKTSTPTPGRTTTPRRAYTNDPVAVPIVRLPKAAA